MTQQQRNNDRGPVGPDLGMIFKNLQAANIPTGRVFTRRRGVTGESVTIITLASEVRQRDDLAIRDMIAQAREFAAPFDCLVIV